MTKKHVNAESCKSGISGGSRTGVEPRANPQLCVFIIRDQEMQSYRATFLMRIMDYFIRCVFWSSQHTRCISAVSEY